MNKLVVACMLVFTLNTSCSQLNDLHILNQEVKTESSKTAKVTINLSTKSFGIKAENVSNEEKTISTKVSVLDDKGNVLKGQTFEGTTKKSSVKLSLSLPLNYVSKVEVSVKNAQGEVYLQGGGILKPTNGASYKLEMKAVGTKKADTTTIESILQLEDTRPEEVSSNVEVMDYTESPTKPTNPSTGNTSFLTNPILITNNGGQLPKIQRNGNTIYIANSSSTGYPEINKSIDNGKTFSKLILPTTGKIRNAIEFDFSENNGVLSFIYQDSTSKLNIIKSTDGGTTWNNPIGISNDFVWSDNPKVYVYNKQNYILFRGYKNNKIELYVLNPEGNIVKVTDNEIQEDNGVILVNSDGIYVAYLDMFSTGNSYLTKSTDGITFSTPRQINKTYGRSSGHDIASNSKGDLFVSYSDTSNDYKGNIYVAKLKKGTNEFTHQKASDSNLNQLASRIKIDSKDNIHLIWNDSRLNKSYGTTVYTSSNDDGNSYKANLVLDNNGGILNGNFVVTSNELDLVAVNYNKNPIENIYYKMVF